MMIAQLDFLSRVSTAQGIRRFWSITGRSQGRHAVFVVRAHTKADAIALVAHHNLDGIQAQEVQP